MYKVHWGRQAVNRLTSLWIESDSALRRAITEASHGLTQRLQIAPEDEGESRSHGRRITFVTPLIVLFRIDRKRRLVRVLDVRLWPQRGH